MSYSLTGIPILVKKNLHEYLAVIQLYIFLAFFPIICNNECNLEISQEKQMIEHKVFKQKTVVQQVMEEIKELIASGQFKVGEQILSEKDLAERFGVSRPTIREAIKVFNYLGVLNSQTGKGTYVSDRASISTEALTWSLLLGSNEMHDLIELREMIETKGIRQLVRMLASDPEAAQRNIGILQDDIEQMKQAVQSGSKESLNRSDYHFHQTIIACGSNAVFLAIYNTLQAFMLEEMHKTHEEAENKYKIIDEHQLIVDGILSGNEETALTAFNAHMQSKCFQAFRTEKPVQQAQ
jgi:GntR family transcriptional regulator, transcriptional repressor for pyruvate dehydrogenase complex